MVDANSAVELCRVTIVAPRTRMDLALPVEIPLADLLPTLLRHAGEDPDDPAFLRGGWVLQRLGENALDPSQRLTELGIRDGEVLHLRQRESAVPEFIFDDVADAIGAATRTRRSPWQPTDTRNVSLVLSGLFLALGATVALTSGPPWLVPTVVILVTAVGLLLGGIALSRAFGQGRVGMLTAAGGVAYAATGGLMLLGGEGGISSFGAPHVLVGASLGLVAAAAAAFGVVSGWDGFFSAGAVFAVLVVAATGRLVIGADAAAVAAATAAVVLAFTPLLPTFAARLAKLPIPQLPTGAEELRTQIDVLPGPTVLEQAITADRLVAALVAASSVVVGGCSLLLIQDPRWYAPALVTVMALAWLLRARHFLGRPHRIWLLGGGVLCAILVALRFAMAGEAVVLLTVGVPCLVVAAGLAAWGVAMPGRRLSPYWARGADVLEVLILLAVIPLAAGVMGLYGAIADLIARITG